MLKALPHNNENAERALACRFFGFCSFWKLDRRHSGIWKTCAVQVFVVTRTHTYYVPAQLGGKLQANLKPRILAATDPRTCQLAEKHKSIGKLINCITVVLPSFQINSNQSGPSSCRCSYLLIPYKDAPSTSLTLDCLSTYHILTSTPQTILLNPSNHGMFEPHPSKDFKLYGTPPNESA